MYKVIYRDYNSIYPSSQNQGSPKWIQQILVTFQTEPFFTCMWLWEEGYIHLQLNVGCQPTCREVRQIVGAKLPWPNWRVFYRSSSLESPTKTMGIKSHLGVATWWLVWSTLNFVVFKGDILCKPCIGIIPRFGQRISYFGQSSHFDFWVAPICPLRGNVLVYLAPILHICVHYLFIYIQICIYFWFIYIYVNAYRYIQGV